MFVITVAEHHNFLVSNGKYWVHNGAGGATFLTTIATSHVGVLAGGLIGAIATGPM